MSFYYWDDPLDTWDNASDTWDNYPVSTTSSPTLTVEPVDYDGLLITWPLQTSPVTEQLLLRSSFGTPLTIYSGDGFPLVDQTIINVTPSLPNAVITTEGAPFLTSYLDTDLTPGRFYYYSLIVYNSSIGEYELVGAAQGLVLTYWAFGAMFASWMPNWYLSQDDGLATAAEPIGPLQRFLNLLGYEMDWIRSEIESFFLFTNPSLISGAILPYLGANLGVDYEPELGMARTRVLVENAVYLYKNKGTLTGVAAAASAFSGYGCVATMGSSSSSTTPPTAPVWNQEIQLDDAAFDSFGPDTNYGGHWFPGGGTSLVNQMIPFGDVNEISFNVPGGTVYVVILTTPSDPNIATGFAGQTSQFDYPSNSFSGPGTFLYEVTGHGDTSFNYAWNNGGAGCVATSIEIIAFSSSISSVETVSSSTAGVTPEHASYIPAPAIEAIYPTQGYLPVNNENVLAFTAIGQFWMTTCTPANAQVLGIPIPQLATPPMFVVSGYFRPYPVATPTLRQFFIQIDWYGIYGNLISSTAGTPVMESATAWVRASVVGTPPAGAYKFGRTVKSVASLADDVHLFDAEQVEMNTLATPGPTSWQPPRDIKINLLPNRQNLIVNPTGGASTTTGWSISGGSLQSSLAMATPPAITWPAQTKSGFVLTAEPSYTALDEGAWFGAAVPALAFPGGGAFGASGALLENIVLSTLVPIQPGISYSFSAYVEAATIPAVVQLAVTFFNASNVLVPSPAFTATLNQTLVGGHAYALLTVDPLLFAVYAGQSFLINLGGATSQLVQAASGAVQGATTISVMPFVANANYALGTTLTFSYVSFNTVVGSFTRGSHINIVAPLTAVQALVQATIVGPPAFAQYYFGAPLFEPLPYLLPYFDGSFMPTSDYLWEGTPYDSISDYYPNYPAKLSRLVSVMPEYTPIGSTFSLLVGSAALANAGLVG